MNESPRRPRWADLRAPLLAGAATLLAGAAWGALVGLAHGERGHLWWRAVANHAAIARPWALGLALVAAAQFAALLGLLGRRRRAAVALLAGWTAAVGALAAVPALLHGLATRIPPEKLPVFANDPASMEAFLRRILAAVLLPDRLWLTFMEKPTLWILPLLVPLTLGLLAYAVLHWPLRRWSSEGADRAARASWLAPLLIGALAGAAPPFLSSLSRPSAPGRPDVVLISIDTLRVDAVGVYGGGDGITPNLDRLAAEGARLLGARAPSSWTLPSHAAMLTGQWPWALGVCGVADALPGRAATLASMLAGQGYDTFGAVTHLFVDAPYGFGHGFDRLAHPSHESARDAVAVALEWLRERPRSNPAFLFLHLYDAHWPYQPPDDAPAELLAGTTEADRRETQRYADAFEFAMVLQNGPPALTAAAHALYRAEVWGVDRELAVLFAAVRRRGRPTVIAVVSDHGEMFHEHGMIGHGITLFEEEVRVPFIIAGPGIPAGAALAGPASLVDLAPTLLDLAGVRTTARFDGRSLARELRAGAALEPRWLAGENRSLSPTPVRYVSDGAWKWCSGIDQQIRTARAVYPAAVHRLDRDPGEAVNLLDEAGLPDFAALAAPLFAAVGRADRAAQLSAKERERLRSLGYLP